MPSEFLADVGRNASVSQCGNELVTQSMKGLAIGRPPFALASNNAPCDSSLLNDLAELG